MYSLYNRLHAQISSVIATSIQMIQSNDEDIEYFLGQIDLHFLHVDFVHRDHKWLRPHHN